MILVLAIILFIIFLIYSIKPGREEYTLEGLKLSWKNKASIEGVVTKWIVTLKDSSGNVIHTYENNESKNLKNFTDVSMNIVNKKEFESSIIGDNTLELYYNETKDSNKLYTKTVTFTEEDFGGVELDMSKLEEIVPNIDCVGKYIKVKKDKNTEGAERFACGPEADSDRHYCQFWKHKIEIEKRGTGKACSRADNFVIKTQWPTETTASKRIGTPFQNDPNPNTDENVLNDPQHYKNIWDRAPSRITEIPHQIPRAAPGGWCNHATAVHQDVPGCGRICSDSNTVGRKDKGTWGSWDAYPGSVDCPDAKLDQVWKKEGNSRKLAVGKYSESEGLPDEIYMTGGKDGKYCAVDGDIIKCNYVPNSFDSLEKFKLTKNSDGTYSFKGGNKYCADEDNRIKCNRGGIGGWEKFKIGKYNKTSLSLRAGNSGAQLDGGGKVYYMDRHNINCGSDALNGFGLIRQPGGRTQYNYLCLKPGNLTKHDKRTGSNWQGHNNGNVNSALYLDRHTVDCSDKPITQFRLHRDGTKKVYYKYKCGNVSTQNNACRNTSTPWNQESDNVHYLDRHYAKCNPDEYMTKFRLGRDGKGKFRYEFRCCKKN